MQFAPGVVVRNASSSGCTLTISGSNVEVDDLVIDGQDTDLGFSTGSLCLTGKNIVLVNLTVHNVPLYPDTTTAVTVTGTNITLRNPVINSGGMILLIPPAKDIFVIAGSIGGFNVIALAQGGAISNVHINKTHASAYGYAGTCWTIGDFSKGSNEPNTGVWIADNTCTLQSPSPVAAVTGFSINSHVATIKASNTFTAGKIVGITGLSKGTYLKLPALILASGLSSAQFQVSTSHGNEPLTIDKGTADSRVFGAASLPSFNTTQLHFSRNSVIDLNQYLQDGILEFGCTHCEADHNVFNVTDTHGQAFTGIISYGSDQDIHDNQINGTSQSGEGIFLYPQKGDGTPYAGDNNVVRNNFITTTGDKKEAIGVACNYAFGSSSRNTLIQGNRVVGSFSAGVLLSTGDAINCPVTARVVQNTFDGPRYGITSNASLTDGGNSYLRVGTNVLSTGSRSSLDPSKR